MDDGPLARLAGLIAASPHNLVSEREREPQRLEAHLREAHALGALLRPTAGERWLDLGTGGGIPGLVLALEFPQVAWTLLDSVAKKANAVEGFAQDLGLQNVSVVCARAEDVARESRYRGQFDGVVARAVAPLVTLVELARGFPRDGGMLAAVKGPRWRDELARAQWAVDHLGWRDVEGLPVPGAMRPTWLVTMRATGAAGAAVPRRAGIPHRRPLTGDAQL